jgi:epoxyqueuosine reductase
LNSTRQYTDFIKKEAKKSGFDYCGIAKAEKLNEDAFRLEKWHTKTKQGNMK